MTDLSNAKPGDVLAHRYGHGGLARVVVAKVTKQHVVLAAGTKLRFSGHRAGPNMYSCGSYEPWTPEHSDLLALRKTAREASDIADEIESFLRWRRNDESALPDGLMCALREASEIIKAAKEEASR